MAKNKHLTDAECLEIEHGLRHGLSLKKIAAKIGKHHSTVARVIRARRIVSDKGAYGRVTNRCASRLSCDRRQLCADRPDCTRRCSACRLCNPACPDFEEESCPRLAAAPYVCNGCAGERACVLRKRYYLHNPAHRNYRDILVASREGANITKGELLNLDGLLSPLVKGGQSVHHVIANNPDRFSVNEKTVYKALKGRSCTLDITRFLRAASSRGAANAAVFPSLQTRRHAWPRLGNRLREHSSVLIHTFNVRCSMFGVHSHSAGGA